MNENLLPVNVIDMVNNLNNDRLTEQQREFYLKKLNDIVAYIQIEVNKYHIKHSEKKKAVQKKIVDQVTTKPVKFLLTETDKEVKD